MNQIPVFVINLDRSSDRLEEFSERMEKLGLQFERVSATDAADISEERGQKLLEQRSGHLPLGKGEMGCFLSHRTVWSIIVDRKIEWAFVAEDDAHFGPLDGVFSNKDWLPSDADLVKAETVRQRIFMEPGPPKVRIGSYSVRRLDSHHGGSAGYFVSLSGAETLLGETETKCDALDHVLFHPWIGIVQNLEVYQMDPALCVQDYLLEGAQHKGFASTLNSDRKQSRNNQDVIGKPKGLAKVWREISRPFVRLYMPVADVFTNLSGNAIIKRVPFSGDVSK